VKTELQEHIAAEIINAGQTLAARGWVPATSGNFSRRVDHATIAITASGRDKGELGAADILLIGLGEPAKPGVSAETPIHLALYEDNPDIGAILHTHSLAATVISMAHAKSDAIMLSNYEIVKGLRGFQSHEETALLPLFPNSQDMNTLATTIRADLKAKPSVFGFLLAGHGLYAWGSTMREARRHLEAYEFLLACELERGRYRP
jgi:methylthioribulose-1-phosphate dehydratase